MRMNSKGICGWALAGFLVAAGICGMPLSAGAQESAAAMRGLPDFTPLVEQVGPSVVNIRTIEKVSHRGPSFNGMDEDMLEFFRQFGFPVPGIPRQGPQNQPPQERPRPRGVGSGFILTPDGFVMTNAHVIDGADEVLITLTDKRELKAKIVGADKRTDVAVLKIEANNLPAVKIGDVARLKVGEWVMAIGSPFGLENTVTAGIVSAKQRDTGDYLPFIQTDVAVNPGNSGGPLINMRGEVVGINSQIYSRSGGFMGISFAIPIDEAMRVSEQLRTSGRVSRGKIGVHIEPVSKDIAESIGLGKERGAQVRGVEADSPAEKAGIEAGDIIIRYDGKEVDKVSDLPRLVGNTKPGTKTRLTVFRRGAERELTITIGEVEADEDNQVQSSSDKEDSSAAAQPLGLVVAELTAEQRKELKVKGVRVVQASGAAARAGVRPGDVIVALANQEIGSVKDFKTVMAKVDKKKPVNVLLRRGEWAQYVLIQPSAEK